MSSIAKAYVQVIPSAQGIKGKLSSIFGSEGDSAGSSFGSSLIGKVKGLIAAAGLGKAITDSLMTGADFEQLKGGVQKIFDEMDTATIMADAANAYKDLNMSANQYLATINDVGASFSATMGDEKGYSVAKTGLQAISDYASGTGKNVDELSQKFTMITRSTSSYQSIADQFSGILPATSTGFLEQAQAAGILSDEYTKLTDVPIAEYQQAVSEMLAKGTEELGLTGNTAAETAETFSGSLAAMKAAYSNFLGALSTGEDIGASLNVLGETVFTFVSGNLLPMVGNIFTQIPNIMSSAFSMAIRGLNLVASNAASIVQMGIDLVTGIGTAIISAAPYLLEAAVGIVTALGAALLDTDWASVGNDTISVLRDNLNVAAGEILGTDGSIVESVLAAISANLPGLLEGGVSMISSVANGLLQSLPNLLESGSQIIMQLLETILSALPQLLSAGMNLVVSLAGGIMANGSQVLSTIGSILGEMVATIISHAPAILEQGTALIWALISGITAVAGNLLSAAGDLISSFFGAFSDINWSELGSNIIDGIYNGIMSGVGAIISAAKTAARSALNAAKEFLQIASPSKVMRDQVGKFIPAGMAVGIEANTKPLQDAMHNLSDLTTDTIQTDLARGTVAFSSPVSNAGNTYGNNAFTFNIYASDNMDVDELADSVMQRIQFAVSQREVCFA